MTTATLNNASAITDLVHQSIASRTPICDYGIAHGDLGHPPPANHVQLIQAGGIIEHYERDLTVRVAGGMKWLNLQEVLAQTNQFLPIDADDDMTVGEVIVHNVYGPLRLAYGSCRDLLLGLHYIDGKARDIHVGGRTVKNVAGYDVTRFMVGSLGQMGIVHEATLRTYAIAPQVMAVQIELSDPAAIDPVLSDWMLTSAAPTWLQLQFAGEAWRLSAGYYGSAQATHVQLAALQKLVAQHDEMNITDATSCSLNDDLAERQLLRTWRRRAPAVVKVIVPPAQTGKTCKFIAQANPQLAIDAMPTHGCIFTGGDMSAEAAVSFDLLLMDQLHEVDGLRTWHRRPDGAQRIKPFGPPQPDWFVINRLYQTMNPNNIFNPGRFLPVDLDES
jgi:glycolate oxidase FAD binding subunit